jgi:rod shape-determining protein MreC
MKPLNLVTLLVFLAASAWALTRSESSVRQIQKGYYTIISPFVASGSAMETKIRAFDEELEHSKTLFKKLKLAETELVTLSTEIKYLQSLEKENVQLRAALDFKERTPFSVIAAKVIRRKPSNWWETAHIDRGERHGISPMLAVIAAEGLVGKVDRPDDETSTVILLTDEACQVSAKVVGTHEFGILSGQRAQNGDNPMLRLRYLSRDSNVKTGQKVITTGKGQLFQKGIALGTIIDVNRGPLYTEAQVKPAVNFTDIETVFVLKK